MVRPVTWPRRETYAGDIVEGGHMSSQPTGQAPDPLPVSPKPPSDPSRRDHPHFDDPVLLEDDETVPPRPEEDAADLLRAEPDPQD
jgi:hypothetical protein